MLAIKLSRKGKKNQPFFRIIVLEKSKDPVGNFLEDLGHLNPLTKKNSLKVDRIKYWISQGAQTSGSVHNLLIKEGVIKADKVKVTKTHKKKVEEKTKTKEVKESVKEEAKEEAKEPIKEPAKEEAKEEVKEPVNEEINEKSEN